MSMITPISNYIKKTRPPFKPKKKKTEESKKAKSLSHYHKAAISSRNRQDSGNPKWD